MNYLVKHIKVAIAFFKISWKNSIEYMNDFAVLCVDFIVTIASTIIFWRFLLVDYEKLGTWSMAGLILIGIFGNASWAIGEIFAGAWALSGKITEGRLDKYMCRPVNTLFSCVLEDMQVEEMIKGILSLLILLIWHGIKFDIAVNPADVIYTIVSLVIGVIIVAIVRCLYSCSAFWFENTEGLNFLVHMEDFGLEHYPLDIFNKTTKLVLLSIIPVGFVSYFPAMFYMHIIEKPYMYLLFEVIAMIILALALHLIWKKGIKKYEATGG